MAFLAPLAAAGKVGAAAGAAATGGALASGVTAGSILGTGAATSGVLGGLGLNALGGMASVLPAAAAAPSLALPALATKGLTAAAAPGIFAKAAPALGGLQAGTTIPTAFNAAAPFANAASGLASVAPGATGFKSLAMANAPLTANPASWNAVNQFAGLGSQTGNLAPEMVKASQTVSSQLANQVPQQTPGLVENIRNANTAMRGPANMSYAQGAQGLSPNAAALPPGSPIQPGGNFLSNLGNLIQNPSMDAAGDYIKEHPMATAGLGYGAYQLLKPKQAKPPEQDLGSIRPYEFTRTQRPEAYEVSPLGDTSERMYFDSKFTPLEPYSAKSPKAKEIEKIAGGGIASAYAVGGPVETMSAMNAVGGNMMYPQAQLQTPLYSNPLVQRPEAVNVISPSGGPAVGAYTGEQKFAGGGISDLGSYSDGGRLLKGPGDGVSDSIPAVIGKRQPARLADGEFVIPARIVSELGNGSTEAGARKLYAMMERVQNTRRKSIGKKKVAVNSKADKHLPA
jgi:hypothetical protein